MKRRKVKKNHCPLFSKRSIFKLMLDNLEIGTIHSINVVNSLILGCTGTGGEGGAAIWEQKSGKMNLESRQK